MAAAVLASMLYANILKINVAKSGSFIKRWYRIIRAPAIFMDAAIAVNFGDTCSW